MGKSIAKRCNHLTWSYSIITHFNGINGIYQPFGNYGETNFAVQKNMQPMSRNVSSEASCIQQPFGCMVAKATDIKVKRLFE